MKQFPATFHLKGKDKGLTFSTYNMKKIISQTSFCYIKLKSSTEDQPHSNVDKL